MEFILVVMEAQGLGFAEDSISILCSLGESIGHRVGCPDVSVCTKQLFHRIAIALARGGESSATIGPLATSLTNSSLLSGQCNLIYSLTLNIIYVVKKT